MSEDSDDEATRQALRLPDPDKPASKTDPDDWEVAPTTAKPDLFIPLLAVGSFAAFAAIIGSEYLTRGICPPFLDTCINFLGGDDTGGWGS